jgi:hypothetical protein
MTERGEEAQAGTEEVRPGGAGADAPGTDRREGSPDQSRAQDPAGGAGGEQAAALLPDDAAGDFERRWHALQVSFVDEPQRCVQDADALVGEVMQRITDVFAEERRNLETQWSGGGEASTEDLRVALQRYRSFFNRLLRTS